MNVAKSILSTIDREPRLLIPTLFAIVMSLVAAGIV